MNIEIERKYLVKGEFKSLAIEQHLMEQGYLSSVPERTVRIRVSDDKGYITIKGIGSRSGMSRFEWEKSIPREEAEQLLMLCEPTIISKVRYIIPYKDKIIEVDEFHGENEGLILAEIELQSEQDEIELPDWISLEVTGDKRYYNSFLSRHPFRTW